MQHKPDPAVAGESSSLAKPVTTGRARVLVIFVGDASARMLVREPSREFRILKAAEETFCTLRNLKGGGDAERLSWAYITFHDWASLRYPVEPISQFDPEIMSPANFEASKCGTETGRTRIHTGLDLAAKVASDFREDAASDGVKASVLVMLMSTGECLDPVATFASATRLKDAGATLATVGYSAVGEQLLIECASPERHFRMFEVDSAEPDSVGRSVASRRRPRRSKAAAADGSADNPTGRSVAKRQAVVFCADASRPMTEPFGSDRYAASKAAQVSREIYRTLERHSTHRAKDYGYVTFDSTAFVRTPLTPATSFDPTRVGPADLDPTAGSIGTGPTRIHTGLDLAGVLLRASIGNASEDWANRAFVYLFTNGHCSEPEATVAAALRLRSSGAVILGSALSPEGEELVRACISDSELYLDLG